MIWWKLCNGGRSAMVFQHIADLPGEGLQWGGGGLQYNTGTKHTAVHVAHVNNQH